jgi:hypothetical protein
MKRLSTLAAIAAFTVASSAFAGTISYTHTTADASAPFTDSFSLQKFDTTLGTLDSIIITLSYSTTGEVDVFNSTSQARLFTAGTSTVPLTLSGPAALTIATNAVAGPISGSAAPGFNSFTGITGSGSPSVNVASSDFSFFEGSGVTFASFSLVGGNGSFSGTAIPGVFFSGSAVAGGNTTITYNYSTPSTTPEPATMTLFGSALLGIGFFARKRSKKV